MFPRVMPLRERAEVMRAVLRDRLDNLLPDLMTESGLDMWIVLCQEDDLDPVFRTMVPMDSWCPILQMLVFHRTPAGLERLNLSMTDTGDLYDRPWRGREPAEQWRLLAELVRERDPQRIGINTGSVQWAAGGLTHNLYRQLVGALGPELAARLESAEPLATRWLATLTETQIGLMEHVVNVAHALLRECYSRAAIIPGLTTTRDLEWCYWQRVADLGLEPSFKPFFVLVRSEQQRERHGPDDLTIRPGDVVHSDVGIRYLGLCSDHQQPAYILGPGETGAPAGWQELLAQGNRLQDIYLGEFRAGLTGNELLHNILSRARQEGVPNPRVYSHSLGHLLHEPGPLIGLPWEQEACPGRGDVVLHPGYAFTMELSVSGPVAECGGQEMTLGLEEDVVFTEAGCRVLDGRLTEFHLV
ncbi:MAG: aminopeptidase P family protein [Armatimonadetes bacterium]|nr:aminopeptidase P family protein [Armatimonadota bacterium]